MADATLLSRAASCYLRGGAPEDAARCYRDAGAYRQAAETWESIGVLAEAAADFAAAGMHERAAWILVHELGDPAAARAELAAADARAAQDDAGRPLGEILRHIVRARCNVAEQVAGADTLAVLQEAMDYLEQDSDAWHGEEAETRATAVAEAMTRPDLVALVFAASVRGGRHQAAQRWDEWSQRVLSVPLVLPEPGSDPGMPGGRPGEGGLWPRLADDQGQPPEDL